jgi:hypothetical protein
LIFYVATKGLLVGMGDPPSIIYPDGYGSGKIPPPTTRYGDTRGVILLSWGWVWGVHTIGIYPLPSLAANVSSNR